jgi:ABC-type transport system involved in multi-copper enzyme maturation permease subunit
MTIARPTIWTLAATELRKMVDTRAGLALLVVTELLAATIVVVQLLASKPATWTFEGFFSGAQTPMLILLPVLGVLSVSTEWSQRTALTTFALVPRRERVLAAKMLAAGALAALAVAACALDAALGNLVAGALPHANGSWHLTGTTMGAALLVQLLNVLLGVGFGVLLQSSPLAIVVYFVLPTAWAIVGGLVSWLHRWAAWLDMNTTTAPLMQGAWPAGNGWAKLAVSAGLWVGLPLALGLARLLRSEVK